MNTYKRDFAPDSPLDTLPGMGRSLLQVYTGNHISENEARVLLRKIADHKWHVSQKLSRDVGFHVAAIDFVEKFLRAADGRKLGLEIHLENGTDSAKGGKEISDRER